MAEAEVVQQNDVRRDDAAMNESGNGNAWEHKEPDELYRELVEIVRKYHPSDDISLIEKAYKTAKKAHEGQKRKSGEPYIVHPLCVAIILASLEMDKETIIAGLLHDVIEDTDVTPEEMEKEFGSEITAIVDGVTKLGQLNYSADKVEKQAENLRKMFLAMAKDIRVIIVKLADRLHNMRTLQYMDPGKQKDKARETLDIFSPIAQRLGISALKDELDDLSLKYMEPEVFKNLVRDLKSTREEREKFLSEVSSEIKKGLEKAEIPAVVKARVKHFFSIYRKMVNQDKSLGQIYDIFAVRVIVKTVKECYAALGVMHEMYTPVPGRLKDYIAMPKPNRYQSIHNTLIGPGGRPFEIQIRTEEMDRIAEYGIAAHWKYKETSDGKTPGKNQEEEKLNWLRRILEWQQDMSDDEEFLNLLKSDLDLFNEEVYCFSPAGDVKSLPAGSCAIDFAYMIHSAVGNTMVGARINGKLVPIETELHNGDRVEIITSQNSRGPSLDWLKVVKSPLARNRINHWFRNQSKGENVQKGRDMLFNYAKARGKQLNDLLKPEYMAAVTRKYGFRDWDSVLAAVGHGGLREGQVLNKLLDLAKKDYEANLTDEDVLNRESSKSRDVKAAEHKGGIIVHGVHDVAVRFSKCCSPIPGDEIVGFVTRGRGITIHRTDCDNIINLPPEERERLIEAEWDVSKDAEKKYLAEISIYAKNRTGMLVELTKVLSERKIDIKSMNVRIGKQENATVDISFEVDGTEELGMLMNKLRQIDGVLDIQRTKG